MGDFSSSRRVLLHNIGWSLAGLGALLPDIAGAQMAKVLDEGEPQAKAVGYRTVASKVDGVKYPTYKPGQSCTTCKLLALGSARMRPCSLFANRLVNPAGWCNAWVQRGT